MRRRAAIAAGLALALPAAGCGRPAAALELQLCPETRQALAARLARGYDESPAALGVAGRGGGLVELFRSPHGETWTLLLVLPDGRACMIAAGEDWQPLPPAGAMKPPA